MPALASFSCSQHWGMICVRERQASGDGGKWKIYSYQLRILPSLQKILTWPSAYSVLCSTKACIQTVTVPMACRCSSGEELERSCWTRSFGEASEAW